MMTRRLTALLSIVFLSFFLNISLNAAADAAIENIASYTVKVSYPSEDDTPPEPVAGVEVSIYLVALLDENGLYQPLMPFSDFNVSALKEMTAAESQRIAYLLADRIAEQKIAADMTAVTASDGTAEFNYIAAYGFYLTVQTASAGEAERYSNFEPFLIQIPEDDAEQGRINNVKAEPKMRAEDDNANITTTVQTTTTSTSISTRTTSVSSTTTVQTTVETKNSAKDNDRPKTGDESKLQLWQIIFGISILGIAAILTDIIKDKGKKKS